MKRFQLTGRGRGVLASGTGLVLAAIATGSPVLWSASWLAITTVAAAIVWSWWLQRRVRLERGPIPAVVGAGQPVSLTITVSTTVSTGGSALLSGIFPDWATSLGAHGRVGLSPASKPIELSSTPRFRGQYKWPDLVAEIPDPFGLVHSRNWSATLSHTIVLPAVQPLGQLGLAPITESGEQTGNTVSVGHWPLTDQGGNPIPRDYRIGDDLRRIHWPATARLGEPMVRAEDAELGRRAVVVLDTEVRDYVDSAAFERAITVVASVAVALIGQGWSIRCRRSSGTDLTEESWLHTDRGLLQLLTALALLDGPDTTRTIGYEDSMDALILVAGARTPLGTIPNSMTECVLVATDRHPPEASGFLGTYVRWLGDVPLSVAWRTARRVGVAP